MTEDELKQKLPASSVQEYIRHGKEATADDPDVRKMGFDENGKPLPYEQLANAAKVIYWRQLRDYAAEFDELSRRRVAMEVAIAAVKQDLATLRRHAGDRQGDSGLERTRSATASSRT